jgi:hypothetical protein
MKTHLNVAATDLAKSAEFYATLLDAAPANDDPIVRDRIEEKVRAWYRGLNADDDPIDDFVLGSGARNSQSPITEGIEVQGSDARPALGERT